MSYSIDAERFTSHGSFLSNIGQKSRQSGQPNIHFFEESDMLSSALPASIWVLPCQKKCCWSPGVSGLVRLGPNAQAQVIWGGEAERYFRPGAFVPNDGIPTQIQYGYDTNAPFLQFGAHVRPAT